MPAYETEDIRNIALVGHGGSGKTMLAEALLHGSGAIGELGTLERGSTVCDFEPEEKTRQHSLASAVIGFDFEGKHVNVIDTPGFPDFLGRTLPVLSAVETAVVVIDARSGIQITTRRLMEAAERRGMCRMIVVNKLDAPDIDLEALMEEIRESFGSECLAINLPAASRDRVIDCFFDPGDGDTEFSSVEEARTALVDQVVEMDEELMELYLEEGEDIGADRLHDAFTLALRDGHLIPVCFTSATSEIGVEQLLNVLARVMPNPTEGNPISFASEGSDEDADVALDPDGAVVGHVFKVAIDPFVGKLSAFRVHQGTVTKDSQLYVDGERKPFKVGHLFRLQGKDHEEIDKGVPGDICAVAKIDEISFNSVLHAEQDAELRIKGLELPEPMYGLAIEAKTRGDEQKISDTLSKLVAEDPSFKVEQNAALKETVIRGIGDLHLRMMLERMKDRYNVEVETRPPKIPYRESITSKADGHHRHKKQTGGAGQFGEVFLRVEPLERGGGFEFVNNIVGGVIPSQFIPAVEKGIRQVLEQGAVAGYQMEDIRVSVYDGKHHAVDSKEIAFVQAGKKAFVDAVQKAKPIVLEPVVEIDITVPQENMGDIAGDLSGKRGRVGGTNAVGGGMVTVSGQVPLAELETFQSELKSVTGGAGTYAMQFSHYDPVPKPVQDKLVSDFNPNLDDD